MDPVEMFGGFGHMPLLRLLTTAIDFAELCHYSKVQSSFLSHKRVGWLGRVFL